MVRLVCSGLWLLALAGSPAAWAQAPAAVTPHPWGSWFIGTLSVPGNAARRWGGFAEAQVRTNAVARQYFYHEYKAGLSYDLDPNLSVLLGGGRYVTSDFRDLDAGPLTAERRLWQQAVLTQYAHRVKFEHRYRYEQRWQRLRGAENAAFRQRLRYRLNLLVPLNRQKIEGGAVFASLYDEIFLDPAAPAFERNRLYAGLGYQFNAHTVVQLGWLNQIDFGRAALGPGQYGPVEGLRKNNLVLSLGYKILRHEPGTEQQLPTLPE